MYPRFSAFAKQRLGLLALFLLLALVVGFSPWSLVRYGASFALLWVLPGLAWGSLVPRRALSGAERLVVSLGLSFVVTPLTILLLSYIPGPLTLPQLLVALAGAVGLPLLLSVLMRPRPQVRSGTPSIPGSREQPLTPARGRWNQQRTWLLLLIVALIVVALRGINLNYSEFQGDESTVVMRAARALEGDDDTLFRHKKGPAELTIVMGTWRLTGILNEWMARLPFTWANVLGLMAVFLFCRRLSNPSLGAVVVGLLAVEGYLVAFGRIVQYQSLVLVLSTLGLLCLLVYYSKGHGSLILVSATLFAAGSLAHYDAVLALPAGLLLIGARLWSRRREFRPALIPMLAAVAIGLAIIGLFYLPFLQDPSVRYVSSYITERIGGSVYNNLQSTFVLSSVYDSVYFLILMLLALAVTLLTTWAKWGRLGWVIGSILLVATITAMIWPELWLVGETTLAWIPYATLVFGASLAPGQSMGRRAVWIWLAVPSIFYLFFVASPRTHVHTFFTAWAILAGMGLALVARWLASRPRGVRWTGYALAVVLYLLCGYYAIIMFIDHTPEYRRTFPESKHPIYWTPYDQIPEQGLFGFPYRAGWKVVGYLADRGQLGDHYDSNEERTITDYYTRQTMRWECANPDVYITAVNVQDEVYLPWNDLRASHQPAVEVAIEGEPKLTIHAHDVSGPAETYPVEAYADLFDRGTTPDKYAWHVPGMQRGPNLPTEDHASQASLDTIPDGFASPGRLVKAGTSIIVGDFARLIGYRLDSDNAFPGGYVDLTLLWEGLAAPSTDYTVFTHLHDEAGMRGQLDGPPVCGNRPTTSWRPGERIIDRYRIPVWDDTPAGTIHLTIGMYDLRTLERLELSTSDGLWAGDSLNLTEVEIRER
jgi:hypothetical protein